jgi:competence protein ComEA
MKYFWGIAFAVVCTLLGVGLILLVSSQPRGTSIKLSPPPTASPVTVHVAGAVNQPGVYRLPPGSRVEGAILAAGGAIPEADLSLINLAMVVEDGMQIWVPALIEEEPRVEEQERSPTYEAPEVLININTASQNELESLPRIGPVIAAEIIRYRQTNGPFRRKEDIQEVKGIGPVTFEKISELITVGGSPME